MRFMYLCLGALALAGCSKPASQLEPKAALASAWTDFQLGEFDRAIQSFEIATQQNDLKLQALYGLATALNLRRPGQEPAKAKMLYEQIIAAAPDEDIAAWSLLALARMKHLVPVGETPDYKEVQQAYQTVMDRYPNHLAAKEAFIYLQATKVATLDKKTTEDAVAALESYVAQPNKTVFLNPAYSLLAVSYTTLQLPEKRLASEIRALETIEVDPSNPFTDFAWNYWNIAAIAEFEVGDFETARNYYHKLINEYPTDVRKYGAETALKRMDDLEAKLRSEP